MDALHREFANELRGESARNRISQVTLSAKSGLSISTIHRLTTAQKTPTLAELNQISSVLNVPASELIRRAELAAQRKQQQQEQEGDPK